MARGQQQPPIAGVLDQPLAGIHHSLWQARQRPVPNPLRQHQPSQVPQVVSDHVQPQPHLIRLKAMTDQPRHLYRLLAFFDLLLGRPTGGVSKSAMSRIRASLGGMRMAYFTLRSSSAS